MLCRPQVPGVLPVYELSRVRLHAVGPKGARYQDVTLDLRRGSSSQPSGASVLFLENGGGKTVLVRLIFSVILPGRRQVVGTSNSKVLEKFVLASDVAHVALEWRDTRTGDLLVTGKVSEWRGHVVSADSNRLTERWYTFRPTETLDLGTLPFTQDGRIVSLAGFHERLGEADRADSALQVRWVDRRGEWTEHLDSLRLDPELFSYQRKMNAGEGEAADAFTFKTDEAFVDWLLTAIIPDEEPQSFGEVVTGYAAQLASRGELIAERDFVQGALDCLGPLVHATGERTAAVGLHQDALAEAERLVIALAAREGEESERHEILTGRFGDVEVRERGLEAEVRRLNSAVIELNRLVAKLRWEAALEELKRLEHERDDARRLLAAWQATRLLVEYHVAHESAETIRDILRRQEIEAAPLLNVRDAAARRFARGLLAVADTAEDEARNAESQAEALKDVIEAVKGEKETAIRQSGEADAKIEQASLDMADVQAAIRAAVAAGLLADREDVAEAAAVAEEAADEAETRVTDALTKGDEIAAERDLVGADLEAARTDHETKSRAAEKLGERLAAVQQAAAQLCGMSRLIDLLGTEEIVLDTDVSTLVTFLGEAINRAGEEKDALQVVAATDQRVLDALGSGGLLPPSDHIADALDVLVGENITGWSGWEYLSKIRADERDEMLVRYPYLVDGIVLNSGDDLNRAQEKLTEARLLPRTVIAVGTSAAIINPDAEKPAGIGFIVPPNPAMYDVERAEQERRQIQQRQQARGERLKELEIAIDTDKELRSRLTAWRRDLPPGMLAKLTDDHQQAVTDEKQARQHEREFREAVGKLTAEEKKLRQSIPELRRFSDTARRKASSLCTLANDHAKIAGWQETIRTAKEDKDRADQEAVLKGARIGELERQQREAYREADSLRRTASDRREELAHVIGGGSVDNSAPVPDEALESLRSAYQTAVAAYEKVEISADLRAEVERRSSVESQARAAVESLDREVRERASGLLRTPEGSDSSARMAATSRTQRHAEALEGAVTIAAGEEGRLKQAFESYQAQERSLEPYGRPSDISHGEELIRRANDDWVDARKSLEDLQTGKEVLTRQMDAAKRSVEEFAAVRESLLGIVAPESGREAGAFAGTAETARVRRDQVRETVREAVRLLGDATTEVRRTADLLARHATDERFEKVAAPVRRQMISTDRERLPDFAFNWETALRPRFRVLSDELEQIERHRAMLVERLQGMVKHALGRLRAAQKASRLPADLGDWSGLEFLRISFTPPDDVVLAERLGQVIDEVTAVSAGKEPGKRDGLSLVLSAVRAALRPKGVRVEMLKPDAVLRDERVRVAEISDVFSGGQLLTAAIILYCTMAWLRAGERGQAQRQHAGVLFLDNPIGRASAGYLLELQLTVAKKLGVQLVYTTGLFDLNALSVFPLIIRLRNDADLRAGMKYLRVDDEIRTRLPDPVADDAGVLAVSRLFVRADGQAP
jgi:hypothetical protein